MSDTIDSRWIGTPLSHVSPADWISLHARSGPNRTCLVDAEGTNHTFGELNAATNRLGRALVRAGLKSTDRLAAMATDSVEYFVLSLACMKTGIILVPLNYRMTLPEVENVCGRADIAGLVFEKRYDWIVEPLTRRAASLTFLHGTGSDSQHGNVRELWESEVDDSNLKVPDNDEQVYMIMFTSGTTGSPKGVLRSLRALRIATADALVDFCYLPDDFMYSASAMFHVAGIGHMYYGLARGASSLVLPQFDSDALLTWLQRGLTRILVMPTMLNSLLASPGIEEMSFPNLRSIAYGGAPISVATLRRMIDVFDCDFYNTFGAGTETGGQAMLRPSDHVRALAGDDYLLESIGRVAFGIDVRLCDAAMNDVPQGDVGEIYSRSAQIMSGYLDDPDATARAVIDGWFHAGDLAWVDTEGYYYLAGRSNDMIIRGGENVYPNEIEWVLHQHDDIKEAIVIGLPDAHWGERVGVAIIVANGATITLEQISAFCDGKLARYKVPTDLFVVADFPRNANGKVTRPELLAQLVPETDAAAEA